MRGQNREYPGILFVENYTHFLPNHTHYRVYLELAMKYTPDTEVKV